MVKRQRSICDHRQLLLTNRVEFKSLQFQSTLDLTQSGEKAPAILVARLAQETQTRYFVLDGNHRAVALAYLNRPVPYYLIQSKDDISWILQREFEGVIDHFPHRAFLSGSKDFITLLGEAMVASSREADGYSAFDVAYRFVREMHVPPDTKPDELESKQVAENIERCKFVLLKNGEPWLPAAQSSMVDNESNEGAKTARADVSLPERNDPPPWSPSTSVKDVYPLRRSEPKVVSKYDIENWSITVRRYFSSIEVGEEFSCPFSQFASICGEDNNRGKTIADKLVGSGLLERVAVREVATGNFYKTGRPTMQRVTYWRFTSMAIAIE